MHEYAYYGRGNTIHSPGQIEWFQNTCDDKSFHVGGKQVITFLDGYSTPLQCRTGLMYMSLLGKPTDADLHTYPHVLLTGPHEWDIMVRPERTKPPHALFYGKDAKYMRSLRTFGEMAVIAIHEGKKMRLKLDDRGKTCMFVGYADDHTKDVYRFLNIHTRRIILSRDVRWLNIIWKQYKKKSIYARRQVELFLDEEERSLEDERSFGESSIEEIEEESDPKFGDTSDCPLS